MIESSYLKAFFSALALHVVVLFSLLIDHSARPVLTVERQNMAGMNQPVPSPQTEIVKAVSVDNQQVMQTVEKLKQEREQQRRAENRRQQELKREVEQARKERIAEQQRVARLKEEANRIAIARKKQAEEEKKRLQELAEQKALEAKRIEELKKQQQLAAKKISGIK